GLDRAHRRDRLDRRPAGAAPDAAADALRPTRRAVDRARHRRPRARPRRRGHPSFRDGRPGPAAARPRQGPRPEGAAGTGRRRRAMTSSLLAGLGVGLVGALLLATGMDLQSRAVQAADGRSPEWLRDRRWWAGLALLGSAVGTNLVALALAPVSAVQSVNIIALAVSTLLAARSRPGMLTRRTLGAVAASVIGVLGFVAVPAAQPADPAGHALAAQRTAVRTILVALVLLAGAAWLIGRRPARSEGPATDRARSGTTRPRGTGPSTPRALLG